MTSTTAELPQTQPIILYYWGSFMARSNGSHSRMAGLTRYLSSNFERVILYSYMNHPEEPWTEDHQDAFRTHYPDIELVLDRLSFTARIAIKSKETLGSLFPGAARSILSVPNFNAAPNLEALLKRERDPIFLLNYVDGLYQLPKADLDRTIVETHDVKYIKRRVKKVESVFSLKEILRFRSEFGALGAANGIVAITANEAYLFRTMLKSANVFHIPDYSPAPPVDASANTEPTYDLLFVGSGNPLNEAGLLEFLQSFGHRLSDYSIAICGQICNSPRIRSAASALNHVELVGFVEDLGEIFEKAKASFSPVDGTGLKIKIVDALRYGKPVFASRHSMDGLPDGFQDAVLPLTEEAFSTILNDPSALSKATQAARAYYLRLVNAGDLGTFSEYLSGLQDA